MTYRKMRLTETTATPSALDEISFDGIIYLVPISNTNTPGTHHYISGFHSNEQCRMYRALLEGKSFDKSYAQSDTRERILELLVVEATITITPVNEYIIKKTDPVYSTHPHLTSTDLLTMANDLLATKQVEQVAKVKDLITSYPDFLEDYDVICNTIYITQFADIYQVLAVTNVGIYTDVICTPDYQYIMLGNENYQETVRRIERHSEMRQAERLLSVV